MRSDAIVKCARKDCQNLTNGRFTVRDNFFNVEWTVCGKCYGEFPPIERGTLDEHVVDEQHFEIDSELFEKGGIE